MYLVHVIPIKRGIAKETLSYFSAKNIPVGSIVSAPVRRSSAYALVVHTEPAKNAKTKLRSAQYTIKKIDRIHAQHFFLPAFIEAVHETARYFTASSGAVLSALVPKAILSGKMDSTPSTTRHKKGEAGGDTKKNNVRSPVYLMQSDDEERVSTYKSIIREEFAHGSSVFFCVPETQEVERVYDTLSRGIEEHTFVLHSGIKSKEIQERWKNALSSEHPVLIIATAGFLSLPRADIRTIIIEKENARAYKLPARPFIDVRRFAEVFGRHTNARVIFGDIFLRPETLYRRRDPWFQELGALSFRSLSNAEQKLVDMSEYFDKTKKKKVTFLSDELRNIIGRVRESGGHVAILTARRGLHPLTICSDCGTIVQCDRCNAPLVLHSQGSTGAKRQFACHKCNTRMESSDMCRSCGSWRLTTLGAGTDKILSELKELDPSLTVFQIDRDNTPTHKKALSVRDSFYQTPGSVLVGTEMAISYLSKPVEHTAAVSIDALFTIPDFRMSERIFTILLRLRNKATAGFLIQTRNPDMPLFRHVLEGNIMDFHRAELKDRKAFGYPPYATLIKLAREGTKQAVDKDIKRAETLLKEYSPEVYPAFTPAVRGKYRHNILIRLPARQSFSETSLRSDDLQRSEGGSASPEQDESESKRVWPDKKLSEILRALPPSFSIHVDPEEIL